MKKPSYKHAVQLIALNDGNGDAGRLQISDVSQMTTVQLVSDLFDVEAIKLAGGIVRFREKQEQTPT